MVLGISIFYLLEHYGFRVHGLGFCTVEPLWWGSTRPSLHMFAASNGNQTCKPIETFFHNMHRGSGFRVQQI